MLFPPMVLDAIAARLDGDRGTFRVAEVPTGADPLDLVRAAAPVFGSARYFATPSGVTIGSVGVAWRSVGSGPRRFSALEGSWSTRPAVPSGARFLIGFSFAPDGPRGPEWAGFPAAEVTLPAVSVIVDEQGRRLVVAVPSGADAETSIAALGELSVPGPLRDTGFGDHSVRSVPPGGDWSEAVGEAVDAIRGGSMTKVVLARSVLVRTELTVDPFETAAHLGRRNPQCHVYGWQLGDETFVGATPELLVGRRRHQIRANPLAGSARRGDGDEEDHAVGEALVSSAKAREELSLVVDDISSRLRPLTDELAVPDVPSLRRFATVQHLSAEITGRLTDEVSLFELVRRLHPTPAVGGTPRAEAMSFLEKAESIDRGWYSGGVGWLDPGGDGDVVIALRCGLVNGRRSRLYAGNGIVADSDPVEELVETRWKFLPLLDLLTVT